MRRYDNRRMVLIGTCHVDPSGPQRLEEALRTLQPSHLAAEISEDRLREEVRERFRREYDRFESIMLEDKGIILAPDMEEKLKERYEAFDALSNYEFHAVKGYAHEHGLPISYIDLPFSTIMDYDTFCKGAAESNFLNLESLETETIISYLNKDTDELLQDSQTLSQDIYERNRMLKGAYAMVKDNPEFVGRVVYREQTEYPWTWSEELRAYLSYIDSTHREEEMERNLRTIFDDMSDGSLGAPIEANHLIPLMYRLEDIFPSTYLLDDF